MNGRIRKSEAIARCPTFKLCMTKAQARTRAARLGRYENGGIYKCTQCGTYHVTRSLGGTTIETRRKR